MFYEKITEFNKANENLVIYVRSMALFLEPNRIEKETEKKVILLSSVGAQANKLLKTLSIQSKPSDKMF